MAAAPVVAPYVGTYANRTPYLTAAEWQAAPTAADMNDLVPNGDSAAQLQALADCIDRASGWIDGYCMGDGIGVLAATRNTAYGWFRVGRDSVVRMPLKYRPVLEVSTVEVGGRRSTLTALSDVSDLVILPSGVIEVPLSVLPFDGVTRLGLASRVLMQVSYVNGWPNTLSTAATTAGGTSLPVDAALGIYPGSGLTVYDGERTEQVQVASSYVAGGLTLPLVGALGSAHAAGVSVSALPPSVKQAAVLLTTALIQTRGNDAIVLAAMDEPKKQSGAYGAMGSTVALAKELLNPLRRVA